MHELLTNKTALRWRPSIALRSLFPSHNSSTGPLLWALLLLLLLSLSPPPPLDHRPPESCDSQTALGVRRMLGCLHLCARWALCVKFSHRHPCCSHACCTVPLALLWVPVQTHNCGEFQGSEIWAPRLQGAPLRIWPRRLHTQEPDPD